MFDPVKTAEHIDFISKISADALQCEKNDLHIFDVNNPLFLPSLTWSPTFATRIKKIDLGFSLDGHRRYLTQPSLGVLTGRKLVFTKLDTGAHLFRINTSGQEFVMIYCAWPNHHMDKCISMYIIAKKINAKKVYRLLVENYKKYTRKDIQIAPIIEGNILNEIINNSVNFIINGFKADIYGIKNTKGILISGAPGIGKTEICRYIRYLCAKKNIICRSVRSSEIKQKFGSYGIEDCFIAQESSIIFYDDIDISYFSRRDSGGIGCEMLSAMDGMRKGEPVVRIFTTNEKINAIDSAFLRPGRIDVCYELQLPDINLRQKLIDRWHQDIKDAINNYSIAEKTASFSFADLEHFKTILVNKYFSTNKWLVEESLQEAFRNKQVDNGSKIGF